jgi:hypothetical protein
MQFNVDAVATETFAEWLATIRGSGQLLDPQAYAHLAKPSKAVAPLAYHAVSPGLFNSILGSTASANDPSRLTHPASQRAEK